MQYQSLSSGWITKKRTHESLSPEGDDDNVEDNTLKKRANTGVL